MYENILYAAFFFPAAAAVLVFSMNYGSAVMQAPVRLGQDQAYRDIAAQAAAAQAGTAAALTDVQSRLATIEKILTDVE